MIAVPVTLCAAVIGVWVASASGFGQLGWALGVATIAGCGVLAARRDVLDMVAFFVGVFMTASAAVALVL
jgi:hypothetical protein